MGEYNVTSTFDITAPPHMDFGNCVQQNEENLIGNDSVTPCKSLLSVIMKASFSMSSLRDGSPDTEASSMSSPATLPRRKQHDCRRRHATPTSASQRYRRHNQNNSQKQQQTQQQNQSWPLQNQSADKKDEFWEALQSNYDYLMDGGLIETCREANGELSWDDEDIEVSSTWTFKEFLDRYTEINDWMDGVRATLDGNDMVVDDNEDKVIHSDEIKYRSSQIKLFNEQSRRLERRYPNMRDEILSRTNHLNARWTELEGALVVVVIVDDDDGKDEITVLKGEIARQIRWLRKWLREVEEQIGPLTLNHEWNKDDIRGRLKQQQALQREIESRCKCVLAVVKLCEKFRRRYDDDDNNEHIVNNQQSSDKQQRYWSATPVRSSFSLANTTTTTTTTRSSESKTKRKDDREEKEAEEEDNRRIKRIRGQRGSDHTVRVAQNLQRRFHAIWIRSLEWQCWLESLLSNGSAQNQQQAWKDCRSPGDEPKRKCPRLIGTFQSRGGGMVVPDASIATVAAGDSSASSDAFPLNENVAQCQKGLPPPLPIVNQLTGGDRGVIRGHDHHDVGYSSESSAHLSNEESAGEFVRVYTYTTAEATTPRVLEVVVDGEHRPRKTPPRDVVDTVDAQIATTPVENAGSNCGTFYFCHEDSDGNDHRHLSRTKLDFGTSPIVLLADNGGLKCKETFPSSSSSSSSSAEGVIDDCNDGNVEETSARSFSYPKGIHRLVKQAELLVKSPYNLDITNGDRRICRSRRQHNMSGGHGSSCDASGEYTTSGSDSDVPPNSRSSGSVVPSTSSSTSSCEDNLDGSVINLQRHVFQTGSSTTPTTEGPNSGGSDPGAGVSVRLRRKKRVNRDWRLSSGSIESAYFVDAKRLELSSLSEGALNVNGGFRSSKVSEKSRRKFACSNKRRIAFREQQQQQQQRRRRPAVTDDSTKCQSLVSLRHSGSSDNGRWKCIDAFPVSGSAISDDDDDDDDGTLLIEESMITKSCEDKQNVPLSSASLAVHVVLDDFSSMSEQAWDDYQDPPYLSDAYSEKALDGDDASVRRLLEFGDDYRAYMESGNASDGTSTPSLPVFHGIGLANDRSIRPKVPTNNCPSAQSSSSKIRLDLVLDSESDLDDLNDVVRRHTQQLDITRQRLKLLCGTEDTSEPFSSRHLSSGIAEVLATCETHIRCLKKVWAQLTATEPVVLPCDVSAGVHRAGEKLRNDWQNLLMETEEFQHQVSQLGRLQNEVKQLRANIESLYIKLEEQKKEISNFEERASLDLLLGDLKDSHQNLECIKSSLARANFDVHTFVGQTGRDVVHLTNDIVELYRLWDRSNEKIQNMTIELEQLKVLWDDYETRRDNILKIKLPKIVVDGFIGNSKVDLEADLAAFRGVSSLLRSPLESSPAWEAVGCETKLLVERVYAVLLDVDSVESSVCKTERYTKSVDIKMKPKTKAESEVKKGAGSSPPSLLWRVVKAAVPFQLTLIVIFCLACFLEPNCCDNVNNMRYSLAPQLRYARGPPPI